MDTDPLPDFYKDLGIPRDVSLATIRSHRRRLVLKCHPDRVPHANGEEKARRLQEFHIVQSVYEVLSDDATREIYDGKLRLRDNMRRRQLEVRPWQSSS